MIGDDCHVATGQAQRRTPQTTEGYLDAAASAEGDLRRVPSAAGWIDGVPLDRIWLASGRIPYELDDTTIFFEANSKEEALTRFEACLYENEEKGLLEMNRALEDDTIWLHVLVCLADVTIYHKKPA